MSTVPVVCFAKYVNKFIMMSSKINPLDIKQRGLYSHMSFFSIVKIKSLVHSFICYEEAKNLLSNIGNVCLFLPLKKTHLRVSYIGVQLMSSLSWAYNHWLVFQEIWCTLEHIQYLLLKNEWMIGICSS